MTADMITAVVAVIAFVCLAALYVSWRATRLDRLHARIEMARASLDAALLRRCAATTDLATSGTLDPASSLLLVNAEQQARVAKDWEQRELAESNLSQALRAVYSDATEEAEGLSGSTTQIAVRHELLQDVQDANRQMCIARHFYNDSVAATQAARQRPLARMLNLAGRAEMPLFFEMDDALL
jgi:hypothetical protein